MKKIPLLFVLFYSCSVCDIAYKKGCCDYSSDTTIVYDTVVADTVYFNLKDSSSSVYILDCVNDTVVITDTVTIATNPTVNVGVDNNYLIVNAKYDSIVKVYKNKVNVYKEVVLSREKEVEYFKDKLDKVSNNKKIFLYLFLFSMLINIIIFVIVIILKR